MLVLMLLVGETVKDKKSDKNLESLSNNCCSFRLKFNPVHVCNK